MPHFPMIPRDPLNADFLIHGIRFITFTSMKFITRTVWIFFARTLDRLGKGIRTAARDALLSQESSRETKARVFSFHRAWDTVGACLGPCVALVLLHFYPHQYATVFFIAFIPGLISVAL